MRPDDLWRDAAHSAVGLGLRRGRTECGGGAGLDWRARIMIRRGSSLPRSLSLLTQLWRESTRARQREREKVLMTPTRRRTRKVKDAHSDGGDIGAHASGPI